jgi:hypothetical protein
VGLRNGEGPNAARCSFKASESCSPAGERFGSATSHALHQARDRLDESVTLLERALDLLDQMQWGVLALEDAGELVAELRRDVRALIGRRRRP